MAQHLWWPRFVPLSPPPAGIGLSAIAQAHISAMRQVTDTLDIFRCTPHLDLISERSANEAYCIANPGIEYAIFFPDGGHILLDVTAAGNQPLTVRWMDIRQHTWSSVAQAATPVDGHLRLITPREEGYWVAVVKVA